MAGKVQGAPRPVCFWLGQRPRAALKGVVDREFAAFEVDVRGREPQRDRRIGGVGRATWLWISRGDSDQKRPA